MTMQLLGVDLGGTQIRAALADEGGAMRIRSREGHGTIVSVRLPVDPTQPTLAPADDLPAEPPRGRRVRA
mgnify:CR=1 FL=1